MPTLDGIRGLACLLVVAIHMEHIFTLNLLEGAMGSLGVVIFFALSGFLMGALYFEKSCTFNNAAEYVISRFSRITPAYYIAIVFVTICYFSIPDFEYAMTPVNIARSFAFMGSVGVFWSIPPEVQFYGFFLLIWLAWDKYKAGVKWPLAVIVALSLAFIATKDQWGGILLPSKLHIFLSGFLAAVFLNIEKIRAVVTNRFFQILAAAAALVYFFSFITSDNIYKDLLFPVLVALWIMSFSATTIVSSIFTLKPMRVLGAASFSIYLFHDAILRVIERYFDTADAGILFMAVCLAVALGLPLLFHFFAEKPLNQWSKQKARDVLAALRTKVGFLPKN